MARGLSPTYHASAYQSGLRQYFLNVFLVMGIGLGITAGVSWWLSHDIALMRSLFHLETVVKDGKNVTHMAPSLWWIVCSVVELGAVWWLASGRVSSLGKGVSYSVFIGYAALSGLTLAPALYAYTDASVGTVFVVTAAMFLGCALFGHTTKVDLKPLGTFLIMGVVGLIVALVLNIFLQSPAVDFIISAAGVFIFAALTAYDMQKLEALYDEMGASEGLTVYGALTLYLDFINMFLFLLRIFGARKS